jgi:hypothetical protein
MTPTQLVGLSLGCLAALYESTLFQQRRMGSVSFTVLPVISVTLILGGGIGFYGLTLIPWWPRAQLVLQPTLLHLLCGGLFGLGLSCQPLGRVQSLRWCGRVSYGAYLFHLPIYAAFGLAINEATVPLWKGIAALALTLAISQLSFALIESRVIEFVRNRQAGLAISWKRLRLSIGTAVTLVLLIAFTWESSQWFLDHPPLPDALRREVVQVEGAKKAWKWMGVLHAIDAEGFRRTTPFPAKQAGVWRIGVVGDSYPFGAAVAEEDVLSAQLTTCLKEGGMAVEVLNLGRSSEQCEDTLATVREWALTLECDVIVYAMTFTDFLSSYESWEGHTLREIRNDPQYAARFRRVVGEINDACRRRNVLLRLIFFSQDPNDAETVETVKFTENLLAEEGVPFVSIQRYLDREKHRSFRVSHWERHPNAECHKLYADMLAAEFLHLNAVGQFGNPSRPVIQQAKRKLEPALR